MGVQQFLAKVLNTAGREIDLRSYADIHGSRRSFRVAVDIASVVYKATQGFGDMLADERHLDNYGRAELHRQRQEAETAAAESAAAATSDEANANNKPKPEYEWKVQKYVQKCTQFVIDFLEQFRHAGIDVLVVLDGCTPPIKAREVRQRSDRRKEAEALRDAAVDDTNVNLQARLAGFRRAGAGKHFQLVIDGVIASMRSNRIPFLVAPYESDGQLAFLSEKHYVDLIVTEDSDLIACGASPILYKASMKKKNSDEKEGICGMLLKMEDLSCAKDLDLMDFSSAMLAAVFVAAGSDYCEKLKGVGIVTACDAARKAFFANPKKIENRAPLEIFLEQIYKASYTKNLTDEYKKEYENRFLGALLVFRHPIVFNPITGRCEHFRFDDPDPELVMYKPYADLVKDEVARASFVGEIRPSPLACYIAEGWLDPRTMQPRQYARLPDCVDSCYKRWRRENFQKSRTTSENIPSKESTQSIGYANDAANSNEEVGETVESPISIDANSRGDELEDPGTQQPDPVTTTHSDSYVENNDVDDQNDLLLETQQPM